MGGEAMSRSSTHRLRCSQCPALVELTITGVTFCDQARRYVDAIAAKEGWQVEPEQRCAVHREKA
jgi:hypothetical protein